MNNYLVLVSRTNGYMPAMDDGPKVAVSVGGETHRLCPL